MYKRFCFLLIVFLLTAVACTGSQLDGAYEIDGSSMAPTFPPGTILGIDEQAYINSAPQRGEIIVFEHPHSDITLLKRIVGLPGETVEILNGGVFIDGAVLEEPYLDKQPTYSGRWQLGENEYFVLGDNRNSSSDSHSWGPLAFEHIIGKAVSICSSKVAWSCNQEIEPVD